MSSNATLDRFHTDCTVPGTTNAGVDGDTRHAGEGYHTWRNLLIGGDYSSGHGLNASTRDLGGRGNCSAAIDRGGSVPAVQIMTGRLLAAIATERGRYLLRGVREFNGYDGRTVLNRDAVLGWSQNYTPDDSHKTHIHVGFFRDTCEDWTVISDALSVVNGTADITSSHTTSGGDATPITSEEDDMTLTPEQAKQLDYVFNRLAATTPDAEFYVVGPDRKARTVPRGTDGAKPVALADTMDMNTVVLKEDTIIARLDSILDRLDALEAKS